MSVAAAAIGSSPETGEASGALVVAGDADGAGADGEPVSILMMKGEGGWRFRQYLPG